MEFLKINNRRYLGNKYKLLDFIKEVVDKECPNVNVVFDVFSGTGAVASAFLDKTIITNDILYSNYLSHITWFSAQKYNKNKIQKIINEYNAIKEIEKDNYMSDNFANTYFDYKTCKKIGYIRDDIENKYINKNINDKERAMLITSLIYALDKIANTCGHYDAYRKGVAYTGKLILEVPEINNKISKKNRCYNTDSNELAKTIECDLAYLDPPYNSRQYCDAYHLLENIAKWEKPEVTGVAKKMDRTSLKSDYCTTKATKAFEELVDNLKCKYIILSYNNTGDNANGRSNARIKDEDIIRILSKKGKVKIFSKSYKAFTTGKSENNNNEERLFLCIVDNKVIPSPLNYTGGKAKLLPQIKPLFPEKIDTFVDLFCGGCNVGINIPANKHYYNDISSVLIGLYNELEKISKDKLFNDLNKLIKQYNLSNSSLNGYEFYKCNSSEGLGKYNKDKFNKLKEDFNKLTRKDKKYYEMFFLLIIYGFNNQIRFNKNDEYNLPVGKRDFNNNIQKKLEDFMNVIKVQKAIFTNVSFDKFDISELDKNTLVYCDPPYLITTASYNENGGWTEDDEKKLLDFLDTLNKKKIKFALSNVIQHKGRENKILMDWIKNNKYQVHYLKYDYNNSNYQAMDTDKKTVEILVTNYKK